MCGIRVVLVTSKQGYPVHTYDTCTYYDALGRVGCTVEEASQAMRKLSQAMHAEGQYTQVLGSMSHTEGGDTQIPQQKEKDSLFSKDTLYPLDTGGIKPVRADYGGEGKPAHTGSQPRSDTHTHAQQEDTHTYTDSVIDTHTLTHNDVVYDTQEIDSYIHSMLDIH